MKTPQESKHHKKTKKATKKSVQLAQGDAHCFGLLPRGAPAVEAVAAHEYTGRLRIALHTIAERRLHTQMIHQSDVYCTVLYCEQTANVRLQSEKRRGDHVPRGPARTACSRRSAPRAPRRSDSTCLQAIGRDRK